jgi:RNA polymerase sigma factor (sigma-70 family)
MNSESPEKRQLRGLAEGDSNSYTELWKRYGARLQRLAESRLPAGLKRRVDADDVVQSACRSFFRRATGGQLRLVDAESLWHLLCAITMNKVNMQIRRHMRQRRGLDREQRLEAVTDDGCSMDPTCDDPLPDEVVVFADQVEQILSSLDSQERLVVQLKLEDMTNDEIAGRLGCSERTIRRLITRVRARLQSILQETWSPPS